MSGDANDCYLCGAKNDAGASFCGRCNGQLLQLGEAPADPEPEVVDDEPIELHPETSKRMDAKSRLGQLRRKSTLDDSRLSDALGLAGVDDADLDAATEPAPTTAIPKATLSTEIPMLGTHAAVSTTRSLRPEAPSRRVWVLLGLLFLATAALGYTTLNQQPEALAFNDEESTFTTTTTTTTIATTTTEAPLTIPEVDRLYGNAFVHVELIQCAAPVAEGAGPTLEATALSSGVNIDLTTTIIDASPLPGADLARLITRTNTRLALVRTQPSGVTTAITLPDIDADETLQLNEEPTGGTAFTVHFDSESDTVITEAGTNAASPFIAVNDQNQVLHVQIAGQRLGHQDLLDVQTTVDVDNDAAASGDNICTAMNVLSFPDDVVQADLATTPQDTGLEDTDVEDSEIVEPEPTEEVE